MNSKYLVFAGMGLELIGIVITCLFIGQKVDQIYDLKGLAMVGLSIIGLAGWLVQIVMLSKKLDQESEE